MIYSKKKKFFIPTTTCNTYTYHAGSEKTCMCKAGGSYSNQCALNSQ